MLEFVDDLLRLAVRCSIHNQSDERVDGDRGRDRRTAIIEPVDQLDDVVAVVVEVNIVQ